ncbi:hypothetical protein AN958_07459 [Leucoagaricus sp. SymC.cos]|nr:hypothetical protein AN958_07459 [Leucoagaricus sp. SymC.cos]
MWLSDTTGWMNWVTCCLHIVFSHNRIPYIVYTARDTFVSCHSFSQWVAPHLERSRRPASINDL